MDWSPPPQLSLRWQVTSIRGLPLWQGLNGGSFASTARTASMLVLPVMWTSPDTRSARRLAAAVGVGANKRSALASMAIRYSSSGQGSRGSWVRRPASTCATGIAAANPASAAPSALDVSPWTTSRSGGSRSSGENVVVTWRTCACGSLRPGQRRWRLGNSDSPKSSGSRSGCWPVKISVGARPRTSSAWARGASLIASGLVPITSLMSAKSSLPPTSAGAV